VPPKVRVRRGAEKHESSGQNQKQIGKFFAGEKGCYGDFFSFHEMIIPERHDASEQGIHTVV